ncbi:hypothetical protein, partial [Leptolyngbya sp. BC1307]|uniref:hypothetical protein n=1 Tax=Leptolyngbya sp. BC1307 TaxID=2029589 RepID=UPI00197D5A50
SLSSGTTRWFLTCLLAARFPTAAHTNLVLTMGVVRPLFRAIAPSSCAFTSLPPTAIKHLSVVVIHLVIRPIG